MSPLNWTRQGRQGRSDTRQESGRIDDMIPYSFDVLIRGRYRWMVKRLRYWELEWILKIPFDTNFSITILCCIFNGVKRDWF